jgi:hypothetical protein
MLALSRDPPSRRPQLQTPKKIAISSWSRRWTLHKHDSGGGGVQKQRAVFGTFLTMGRCVVPAPFSTYFPTPSPVRRSSLTTAFARPLLLRHLVSSPHLTSPRSSPPPPIHSHRIEHGNDMAGDGTSSGGGAGDGGSNGEEVQIYIAGPSGSPLRLSDCERTLNSVWF